VSQVGQEFQVGKVGKKGREKQVAQLKLDGVLTVNVWKGGPEGSGGVDK
jgi:hypothetical protein